MWAGSVKLLFTVAFLASCACLAYAQTASDMQNASNQPVAQDSANAPAATQQDGFMPAAPGSTSPEQLKPIEPSQQQAEKTEEKSPEPTVASGFGIKDDSSVSPAMVQPNTATIPQSAVATGTNAGYAMDLEPDMVGGYDPNLPPAAVVPYEVQLQQRNEEIQRQAREQAFENVKRAALPMETHEILDVLGRLKDTQEAVQTPTRPAPTPKNVIRTVSTDPAATPHTIHLNAGNVTTVNIVDITGEPWPIVDIGFGGYFDVKPPEAGGHVIRITPMKDFAHGNLVVRLLKMTTPITFTLNSGGDEVNYRFDARIPDYGPNARMPLIDEGITTMAGDKTTTSFLEGVPPSGSKKLIVGGDVDGRTSAYRYAGALYVRTPLSLLSPSWVSSATSADGMNVYVMEEAPVLLLSDKGALVRARIGSEVKEFKE